MWEGSHDVDAPHVHCISMKGQIADFTRTDKRAEQPLGISVWQTLQKLDYFFLFRNNLTNSDTSFSELRSLLQTHITDEAAVDKNVEGTILSVQQSRMPAGIDERSRWLRIMCLGPMFQRLIEPVASAPHP